MDCSHSSSGLFDLPDSLSLASQRNNSRHSGLKSHVVVRWPTAKATRKIYGPVVFLSSRLDDLGRVTSHAGNGSSVTIQLTACTKGR